MRLVSIAPTGLNPLTADQDASHSSRPQGYFLPPLRGVVFAACYGIGFRMESCPSPPLNSSCSI